MTRMLSTTVAIGASAAALVLAAVVVPVTAVGAAPPACGNADLKASYKATDAAMSHRNGKIVVKNISGHRCTIAGYGGVSYVGGGNGTQVGAPADRVPGNEDTVVLQPGDKAKSPISETVAGVYPKNECKPTAVDGFRVYVPNATVSQYIPHATTGCKNSAVHLMSHKPYR